MEKDDYIKLSNENPFLTLFMLVEDSIEENRSQTINYIKKHFDIVQKRLDKIEDLIRK